MDIITLFLQDIGKSCLSFFTIFGPLFFADNFLLLEKISKNIINKKNERINELKSFKSKVKWENIILFHEKLHINNNYLRDITLFLDINYKSGIFLIGASVIGIFFADYNIILDFIITMTIFVCCILFLFSSLILLNWYFTDIKEKTSKSFNTN